jgi:hypothetical protein
LPVGLHGSRQPREGPCGELAPIAPAYHRPRSGGGAGTPFRPIRGAARPPRPPDCHVRGLSEVWVGSVLREGPCGELAPIAPAYHRARSGGGAGTPFRPIRGAARPPRPPDCHVRGLSEVWVGSVLREGPCGELAPIAPAYHRARSGGGAGTPFRPIRGAARPPRPPDCHVRGLTE